MKIEIRHFEKISMTDAVPLAARGWLELLEDGLTERTGLIGWDNKAFVAYEIGSGQPAGVLTYELIDWKDQINVLLGYVLPVYRGHGVYRQLWNALVEKGRTTDKLTISGTTHWDNKEMQQVMEALGRRPVYIAYHFKVEK